MKKEKDLVCGAEIDENKATASYNYQGKTYHFCSEQCRDDFRTILARIQNPSLDIVAR